MRNSFIFSLILVLLAFTSCKKDQILTPVMEEPKGDNPLNMSNETAAMFNSSGNYTTSGKIWVTTDKADATKRYLNFENFKTNNGPDLRIYLAEDTRAKNFVEVDKLSKTGTFSVQIPSKAMLDKQKFVLIWCEDFSVLFGSAELK